MYCGILTFKIIENWTGASNFVCFQACSVLWPLKTQIIGVMRAVRECCVLLLLCACCLPECDISMVKYINRNIGASTRV